MSFPSILENMPLRLLPLAASHLERCVEISTHAFYNSEDVCQRAMFPLGPTSDLQKSYLEFQIAAFHDTRGVQFMGVFDLPDDYPLGPPTVTPNGHATGFTYSASTKSIMTIHSTTNGTATNGHATEMQAYTPPPPETLIAVARMRLEDEDTFSAPQQKRTPPPCANADAYRLFFTALGLAKTKAMGSRTYWVLDLLTTATEAQGRGAGRMLVECMNEFAAQTRGQSGELGVECFLEGTDMGVPLYSRCGYEIAEILNIDMTPWTGKTGRMTIMVRPARTGTTKVDSILGGG